MLLLSSEILSLFTLVSEIGITFLIGSQRLRQTFLEGPLAKRCRVKCIKASRSILRSDGDVSDSVPPSQSPLTQYGKIKY